MNIMDALNKAAIMAVDIVWGWPLVIYIGVIGIILTVALGLIQFRYFITAWRSMFKPSAGSSKADMTPFQAFLNALSASLGNGSIAGMATAVYAGGPGAAFWIFIIGLLNMVLRFAEVFLSLSFKPTSGLLGGPMVYLQKVPGGKVLPWIYAFFCLLLSFASGNAMQANSMSLGLTRILGLQPLTIACILLMFMMYVMLGGASRIVYISDRIVPVKVGLFFVSSLIVLAYHYQALIPALNLIVTSAFSMSSVAGAAGGIGMQHAMRFGISRVSNASEAGIGTAAILFGATGSKHPVKDGIMSMLGPFISANLVCFSIILMIVASGVWNSGLTSTPLTSAAFETVFGVAGGWIVTFLSITFGLGVLVAYAYIARVCWLFLTKDRWLNVYNLLFCAITFLGAIAKVDLIWNSIDLAVAGLLVINLFACLWLLPVIKKGVTDFKKTCS
jgi:AGCS family alanine or glycine:cation symporter